jgi:hypothetical protein
MTEKMTRVAAGLEGLDQVLDRFGSDRTRWPAPVRRDFAGLLATSPEAQARLREAEALDRLLDLAPQPAIDTRALADRIMAAAVKETPAVSPPRARVAWAQRRGRAAEAQWPSAALLAASLVLGAVFGLSGTLDSAVAPLMVAEASVLDIDPGRIALDSDANDLFAEDLL